MWRNRNGIRFRFGRRLVHLRPASGGSIRQLHIGMLLVEQQKIPSAGKGFEFS